MSQRILVVDDSATVRRVVGRTLEHAGYEVDVAADGREALGLAEAQVPDLILLDFVMPHMNGFQFCQAMRGYPSLRDVPVVLMSAKADRIGEQFIQQTGALDAITKPFGPEALLAVTANALSKAHARRTEEEERLDTLPDTAVGPPPEPPAARDEADFGDIDIEALASPAEPRVKSPATKPDVDVERARREAIHSAAMRVAELVAPALSEVVDGAPEAKTLADAIAERVGQDALFELGEQLRRLRPGEEGEVSFHGRTDHVPIGELLQMLQHQKQTGVLEMGRAAGEPGITICMREGMVDLALGHGAEREFLLGRYLIEEGLVNRSDLDMLLEQRGRKLLGHHMVKLGYMTPEDLQKALVRQTSELIYEALRWRHGTYRFEKYATRPEADEAQLGLPVSSVLMEGLRRVDEWRLIEEQIRSFDMVLSVRHDAIDDTDLDRLSPEERTVLDAIDGERTVRQIVEHSHMSSFEACKILFQLMTSGLVRERRRA